MGLVAERQLGGAELEEVARTRPAALVELILQQSERLRAQERAIAALGRARQAVGRSAAPEWRGGGAAPFRLEPQKRQRDPKPPGGAPGHRGELRAVPEQIDQTIEVPLGECPALRRSAGKDGSLGSDHHRIARGAPRGGAPHHPSGALPAWRARGAEHASFAGLGRGTWEWPARSWDRALWPAPRSCAMAWV